MVARPLWHHSLATLLLHVLGTRPSKVSAFELPWKDLFPLRKSVHRPGSGSTSTRLFVSELHVPGYVETKKSYILTDQEREQRSLKENTYSNDDYISAIPYDQGFLLHQTRQPLFSVAECQSIIDEAENVASVMEWTKNRHGNFPTTDLPLVELPETLSFLKVALEERIYPLLRHQFATALPNAGNLRVADGFVVKYDALGGQTELRPHRDGSVLSFNIALNAAHEYSGGGTWFASLKENDGAIKVQQGHMVSHASALLHGGHGITSGKRYIMVAFVILEGYDNWSMRFYNQIRNI